MESYLLKDEHDIQMMRNLLQRLQGEPTVVDFEEVMLLESVRAVTRLWQQEGKLAGFAFVDDFYNLNYETDPSVASVQLEEVIVEWGVECIRQRNALTGRADTLDASCAARNTRRIASLEKTGFRRGAIQTLQYARSLSEPVVPHAFPSGFSLRKVRAEQEVESLVALHRAAFGTENMTVERRLAIMKAPHYEPELDLIAVAPEATLAAFCICGFDDETGRVGYTDPIGVHPRYQKQGLGKAIVTAGLLALKQRGAEVAKLGTSSENIAMQRLANAVGFEVVSENVWFSKIV